MRQAEAMQRAAAMRQSAADSAGGEAGPGGAGDVKTSSRVPVDLSVPAPPELPRDVRGQPASARLRAVANRAVASVLGVAGGRKVLPGGDADYQVADNFLQSIFKFQFCKLYHSKIRMSV